MKILYWTPKFWPDIGGIQILAKKALPVLKDRGHEILVITSRVGSERPDKDIYREIPIRRFRFWESLQKRNLPEMIEITEQVTEIVKSFRPGLIHIDFSGYTAYFQQKVAKSCAYPIVISVHGDLTSLKTGPDTIFQNLFQSANWVTTVSSFVLEKTRQLVPDISNRSSTIYGFSNIPKMEPNALDIEKPCIVGVGRLAEEKGFDLLIESIPLVSNQFPNLKVKIIGNGPERLRLERLVENLDLKDKIEFTGMIDNEDIHTYINSATICVIPSRIQEAFPVVAIEAALMAKPVVASNVGGLPEIILDGSTGRLVENERPDLLASAITDMLMDPKHIIEMGIEARARAEKRFNLNQYVSNYEALYERVAAEVMAGAGE